MLAYHGGCVLLKLSIVPDKYKPSSACIIAHCSSSTRHTLNMKAAHAGTKGSLNMAIMSKVMTSNTCISHADYS